MTLDSTIEFGLGVPLVREVRTYPWFVCGGRDDSAMRTPTRI
jgi:hypothetical protein